MPAAPAVSVVLPVYNAQAYIRDAMASVLNQSLREVELIVVNDASTDHTPEILRACQDPRVHVLRNLENQGIVRALNRGLAAARAPLVARQDADDLSLPGRLAAQVAALEQCSDLVVLGTAYAKIDERGRELVRRTMPTDDVDIRVALARGNPFCHGSVMMRRCAVQAAGGYRDTGGPTEDYDLWLRLVDRGKAANLEETLYARRVSPDSIMGAASEAHVQASRAFLWRVAQARRATGRDLLAAREPETLAEYEHLRAAWRAASRPSPREARARMRLDIAEDLLRTGHWPASLRWTAKALAATPGSARAWRHAAGTVMDTIRGQRAAQP